MTVRSDVVSKFAREGRTILRDGTPAIRIERVDLGDQRFAISPHETDVLTERIVRLLNRDGRASRDARPASTGYRERWLVEDRCRFHAWLLTERAPSDKPVIAYVEKPNGLVIARRRFGTTREGYPYVKAALRRAIEREGLDCYGD